MARIDIGINGETTPRIHDEQDGTSDLRFVWVEFQDRDGSNVILKPHYGYATNDEVIADLEPLLSALEQMRDAARDRIKDREHILGLTKLVNAMTAAVEADTPMGLEDDVAGEAVAS